MKRYFYLLCGCLPVVAVYASVLEIRISSNLNPISFLSILMILIISVQLLNLKKTRNQVRKFKPIILLFLCLLLSLFLSRASGIELSSFTFSTYFYLCTLFLVFITFSNQAEVHTIKSTLVNGWAACYVLMVLNVFAELAFDYTITSNSIWSTERIRGRLGSNYIVGPFYNPNDFAICFILSAAFALIYIKRNKAFPRLQPLVILSCFVVAIQNGSRSATLLCLLLLFLIEREKVRVFYIFFMAYLGFLLIFPETVGQKTIGIIMKATEEGDNRSDYTRLGALINGIDNFGMISIFHGQGVDLYAVKFGQSLHFAPLDIAFSFGLSFTLLLAWVWLLTFAKSLLLTRRKMEVLVADSNFIIFLLLGVAIWGIASSSVTSSMPFWSIFLTSLLLGESSNKMFKKDFSNKTKVKFM